MKLPDTTATHIHFPAIVRSEHDSPLDALLAVCIPRPEALNLLAAAWAIGGSDCLFSILDGGRPVVVLRTPQGRWAACNAHLGELSLTLHQADRRRAKLEKGQRQAYLASLPSHQLAGGRRRPFPDLPPGGSENSEASSQGVPPAASPAERNEGIKQTPAAVWQPG